MVVKIMLNVVQTQPSPAGAAFSSQKFRLRIIGGGAMEGVQEGQMGVMMGCRLVSPMNAYHQVRGLHFREVLLLCHDKITTELKKEPTLKWSDF